MTASLYLPSLLNFAWMWFLFRCWKLVYLREKKYWFKMFFKFNWCFGECFPLICYNTLICICYITLLYMLINKFTTAFSGEKVPRTPVVLTIMAIQFRKKKWNQSGDIYFIENIPKTSENAAHVLQCEFFLKAPL